MADKKYVIGKRTRYLPFETVMVHPYGKFGQEPTDDYSRARSGVYDTHAQAENACNIAKRTNPVGFVVLYYVRGSNDDTGGRTSAERSSPADENQP